MGVAVNDGVLPRVALQPINEASVQLLSVTLRSQHYHFPRRHLLRHRHSYTSRFTSTMVRLGRALGHATRSWSMSRRAGRPTGRWCETRPSIRVSRCGQAFSVAAARPAVRGDLRQPLRLVVPPGGGTSVARARLAALPLTPSSSALSPPSRAVRIVACKSWG